MIKIEHYEDIFYVMALPSKEIYSTCSSLKEAIEDVKDFEIRETRTAEAFEIVQAVKQN